MICLFRILIMIFAVVCSLKVFGQSEKGADYWKKQAQTNPQKALNHFNLGVAQYKQDNLEEALASFDKVIELESELAPVSHYYKAQILKEMGKLEEAKASSNKIQIRKVPKALRKRVLLFKNSLFVTTESEPDRVGAPEPGEKRYSVYLDLAGGLNSNATYSRPATGTENQVQGNVFLGYTFFAEPVFELKFNYAYNATYYTENPSSDSSYHDFTLPMAYYFGDSRMRFIPEYLTDTYAGDRFSETKAGAVDFSHNLQVISGTLYYQHSEMDVHDEANTAYLNGTSDKVKISLTKSWSSSEFKFGLANNIYNYDDTSSVTSSYKGMAVDLSFSEYINKLDLTFYLSFESRKYTKDSSGFIRTDGRTSINLNAGYAVIEWLRVYMDITYSANKSNDADNNYYQTTGLLGLSGGF